MSCGGALTHFSCKLGPKKIFFTALGGAGAPTAPPGYAYAGTQARYNKTGFSTGKKLPHDGAKRLQLAAPGL